MDFRKKTEWLGQLRPLRREIEMLSRRLGEPGPDARASPFETELAQARRAKLESRRKRCLEQLGALYAFIDDTEDSRMRQILTCRYIDGMTWKAVAAEIGEWNEQYPRRLHNRYLEKLEEGAEPEERGMRI